MEYVLTRKDFLRALLGWQNGSMMMLAQVVNTSYSQVYSGLVYVNKLCSEVRAGDVSAEKSDILRRHQRTLLTPLL
jgi:hypothetical protein